MDTVTLLKELIKVDSSSPGKANELVEFVSNYLEERGLKGEIIENNGYKSYVLVVGRGEKTIVLNGHVDVVPGKADQFNPLEIDGKIYGRGSADMKSGCVAMINTMIELSKREPSCRVMMQIVSDEESGGFNCSKYLVDQGYIGDFVICTEPTNLELSIQAKGFMRLDVKTKGLSAHACRPWQGKNAILKGIDNYDTISKLPIMQIGSEIYESSTVTLSMIKGGDIYNKVPDESILGLDIRFIPSLHPYDIIDDIEKAVKGKVVLKALGDPINTPADNTYIKDFIKVIESIDKNKKVKTVGQHGSSDGRFFASKGIPVIEFGPVGSNWHGEDEYVEIESIFKLEKILEAFIRSF